MFGSYDLRIWPIEGGESLPFYSVKDAARYISEKKNAPFGFVYKASLSAYHRMGSCCGFMFTQDGPVTRRSAYLARKRKNQKARREARLVANQATDSARKAAQWF